MGETRIRVLRRRDKETQILARIVDAMLAVETDLQDTTVEQWSSILRDSCRRQKGQTQPERLPMASAC